MPALGWVVAGCCGVEDKRAIDHNLTRKHMFSRDRSATATYRMIARGSRGGWGRAYQAAKRVHVYQPTTEDRGRLGAWSPQRLEMPIKAATMPAATIASPVSAIAQRNK